VHRDVKELVRRGYDRAAESYLAARPMAGADVALLAHLFDRLAPGAAVLDAGCGAGQPVTAALRDAGLAAIGLDLSRRQLELGRRDGAVTAPVQADLVALPFPAGTFAGVVSYYAIFHLPRAEHSAVFAEIRRVLRSRGLALLCLGSRDVPEDLDPESWLGQPMYWSQFDASRNLDLLRAAGFENLWQREVTDPMAHGRHLFVLVQVRG
jgi:SAM-dependent methyltransferase